FNPAERLITMRGLLFREFMAFAEERFGTEVTSQLTPGEPQPGWNPVAAYSHQGLLDLAEHLGDLTRNQRADLLHACGARPPAVPPPGPPLPRLPGRGAVRLSLHRGLPGRHPRRAAEAPPRFRGPGHPLHVPRRRPARGGLPAAASAGRG